MKKVFVLLALVAVGALVFAEDAPAPTYEFSANATGGWTSNLNLGTSSFINDWDISLKFHLLNNLTKSKGAEEGTYGSIEVTHLNLNLIEETESTVGDDSSTWGDGADDGKGDNLSVTAKIVSGPIEVGLYGAPGTNYENAKYVPLFDKDAGYPKSALGDTSDSMYKPTLASSKGLSLKYTFGTFGFIQLAAANTADKVGTEATVDQSTAVFYTATGDEEAETGVVYYTATPFIPANEAALPLTEGVVYIKVTTVAGSPASDLVKGKYLIGGNVQIKPVSGDALSVTIDGGAWMNLDSNDMIFTAKAAVAAGALSASAAMDGGKAGASGSKLMFDAAANVAYSLFEKKDSVNLDFYFANDQVTGVADKAWTDLGLKFVDAEGFVPGLGATVAVYWSDLLDNFKADPKMISFAESLNYKYALSDTTYVKPYEAVRYDMNDGADKAGVYFNAGVEAQLFPNTILTADYAYGTKEQDMNEKLTGGNASTDSVITIKAKVSL